MVVERREVLQRHKLWRRGRRLFGKKWKKNKERMNKGFKEGLGKKSSKWINRYRMSVSVGLICLLWFNLVNSSISLCGKQTTYLISGTWTKQKKVGMHYFKPPTLAGSLCLIQMNTFSPWTKISQTQKWHLIIKSRSFIPKLICNLLEIIFPIVQLNLLHGD